VRTTMSKTGVLFLSHCGYSFMEELISNATARGLQSFVLSSLPLPSDRDRIIVLQAKSTWVSFSQTHELTWQDLQQALQEIGAQGYKVACCLSVWEGYRTLMARANQALGVADMTLAQIQLLSNKYELRQQLRRFGLSQVQAVLLNARTWAELQAQNRAVFIKPVKGIASYGTFPLTPERHWQEIAQIQADMEADLTYRAIFSDQKGFMAEDYIPGLEFSFEIITTDGSPFVIAIHEKLELEQTGTAVLESACVSPPLHLNAEQLRSARTWIAQLFHHLQLHWGCYHLEARYNAGDWEVIEINSRVGGALISPSVKVLTQGFSMTQLWLDNLLYQQPEQKMQQKSWLATFDIGTATYQPPSTSSFFRVYFAESGWIRSIDEVPCCIVPEIVQISLQPGTEVVERAREVFLGQILWVIPWELQSEILPQLIIESQQAIQVQYDQPRSPLLSVA
jgi:predicted ATP-grasp superfamily ATP-dependent carboligase